MSYNDTSLKTYIKSDLHRYGIGVSFKSFLKIYKGSNMFRFTVWFRIARHYNILINNKPFVLGICSRIIFKRISIKYCIDFPLSVNVGYGLKINHGMALVVNSKSVIGNNVMLAHSVTLASEKGKAPVIGDKVRISPGVVIVGGITIGDNVVVGANAVVNKDVPANAVAVGVPNKNILKPFEDFVDRNYFEN